MEQRKLDLKKGNVINYSYLYTNEENKIGLVYKIKKDINFGHMIYILDDNNNIEPMPFSIIDYTIIN